MSAPNVPYDVPKDLNDPDGDIILRSSDQVEFRFFRWPLQRLSPVLSDMFHLPDPSTPTEPPAPPVVQMNETAPVIEALLRLSYPIDLPTPKDPHTVALIIEAIVKLQAEERCKRWIRMATENLVHVNPWAMYAILLAMGRKSCGYNFEEEVRIAARETFGRQVVRPWVEASMISGADYDRLLTYHSDCRTQFSGKEGEIFMKAGTSWPWFSPQHCPAAGCFYDGDRHHTALRWFLDFQVRAERVLLEELRGEAIEDITLWSDFLHRDLEANKVCRSCAKACASKMPAYIKTLSMLMEESISQVTGSL